MFFGHRNPGHAHPLVIAAGADLHS
jgi:hypothetical protein